MKASLKIAGLFYFNREKGCLNAFKKCITNVMNI